MKKFLSGLMIATTLVGGLVASVGSADAQDWRYRRPPPGGWHQNGGWHHHDRGWRGDAGAAAAAGVIGGMIIGGALAQSNSGYYDRGYVYDDDTYVVRRPRRVYVDEYDYPRVRRTPHCRTLIKYDMYGKPYEYKDCDP
mgnify:CR=1 FL=1